MYLPAEAAGEIFFRVPQVEGEVAGSGRGGRLIQGLLRLGQPLGQRLGLF